MQGSLFWGKAVRCQCLQLLQRSAGWCYVFVWECCVLGGASPSADLAVEVQVLEFGINKCLGGFWQRGGGLAPRFFERHDHRENQFLYTSYRRVCHVIRGFSLLTRDLPRMEVSMFSCGKSERWWYNPERAVESDRENILREDGGIDIERQPINTRRTAVARRSRQKMARLLLAILVASVARDACGLSPSSRREQRGASPHNGLLSHRQVPGIIRVFLRPNLCLSSSGGSPRSPLHTTAEGRPRKNFRTPYSPKPLEPT